MESENVLADTPGDASHTVVVGGHLDSVPEGPGINDNGTGVALMLELARLMAEDEAPENRVRFAFWGAEEIGLVGSLDYLQNVDESELDGFVANLNFDMIGSPNGSPFIYDGDGDDWGQAGPDGSDIVEGLFEAWFDQQGKRSLSTPLDGRSDYGGFLMLDIAAGGLFSGAEGTKEFDEAGAFGGVAGEPRDPCYHRACDTIDNIDPALFLDLSRAAAFATEQLARGEAVMPPRSPFAARRVPTTHIGACGHAGDERQ